jgi:hypothetical protein
MMEAATSDAAAALLGGTLPPQVGDLSQLKMLNIDGGFGPEQIVCSPAGVCTYGRGVHSSTSRLHVSTFCAIHWVFSV